MASTLRTWGRWSGLLLIVAALAGGLASLARGESEPPEPPAVDWEALPEGRVRVEICEAGVPEKPEWPAGHPEATERYEADAFGIFRVPRKYVDTGVRADRANPYLLRAIARVELPAGRHRLLLRGRGTARLFVDGTLTLTTPFPPPFTDGHTPIPKEFLDLGPDFRFAPPGNRESWTTMESPGGAHQVILETIVGGRRGSGMLRPETGEVVVAWSPEGSESFRLLATDPGRLIPYNDAGWAAYRETEEARLARLEADRRAEAFGPHQAAWDAKRQRDRHWLASTPEPEVPALPAGYPAANAIDHFLATRHAEASGQAREPGTVDYPSQIRPLLEARCYSCHRGEKAKGGLRLDRAENVLAGGTSGFPALEPGNPDESELIFRVRSRDEFDRMPPEGEPLTEEEVGLLSTWIQEGASWDSRVPPRELTGPADDLAFLRRVSLDTVGVIPTEDEIRRYLADPEETRRGRAVDRLLDDPRWADHWVGYWQDVLAENPNILNPTLNNTGPFRWWIYESLLDNKPIDRFADELIRMQGSLHQGAPAGFAMASQNDVPMAEKAVIVGGAFLGMDMKCARCHDAPAHETLQEQLFSLAAMLGQEPIQVPATSSVPLDKLHGTGRTPLIQVTLEPGTTVAPAWPFPELIDDAASAEALPDDATPRERLAALITAAENERFAQVVANRLWKRLMGRGLVEPVDDWELGEVSHPELLDYLGRELVRGGYDLKHLARLILNSDAYGRAADPELIGPDTFYAATARQRLAAEQILDSLFLATGKPLRTEEVNLDVDGGRATTVSINLGTPRRAWQFASTSNERDRPSLSLPRVQAVVDVLEAFGWRPARQDPLTDRETDPNVLQPAILANGTVGTWLTRLSDDHGITRLALEDQPVEALVDRLYLRIFTREPDPEERAALVAYLEPGYESRVVAASAGGSDRPARTSPRYVSWSNHLTEEANVIQREREVAARQGDPPTAKLAEPWRLRLEDVLWTMLNAPEFLFTP